MNCSNNCCGWKHFHHITKLSKKQEMQKYLKIKKKNKRNVDSIILQFALKKTQWIWSCLVSDIWSLPKPNRRQMYLMCHLCSFSQSLVLVYLKPHIHFPQKRRVTAVQLDLKQQKTFVQTLGHCQVSKCRLLLLIPQGSTRVNPSLNTLLFQYN